MPPAISIWRTRGFANPLGAGGGGGSFVFDNSGNLVLAAGGGGGSGADGCLSGDIGGGVTQWLGALYPGDVTGVHITSAVVTSDFSSQPPTAAEQAYLDARDAYDVNDQGYSEIMCTRPDTVAAALIDSPAGLVAWIIDKYRDWSDCGGDLESRWDKDTLLTVATLYWATATIGSSFRQYYNYPLNEPVPQITVPAAVTLSSEPAYATYPRSLAERVFADLRHWNAPGRGGHFMAHEEPEQVASELRAFFGTVPPPAIGHVAWLADDLEAESARLQEAGLPLRHIEQDFPDGFAAELHRQLRRSTCRARRAEGCDRATAA